MPPGFHCLAVGLVCMAATAVAAGEVDFKARDLNPVTWKAAPDHPPVTLVENGRAKATIAVMSGGIPKELQHGIKEATGVELKIMDAKIVKGGVKAPDIEPPAIVIGDCDLAKQNGLDGSKLPPEGFAIKTAPGLVFIVGNGQGIQWGCYEFLERFVGMRWYFPTELGQSIPRTQTLSVPPVWLEDAPVFRRREIWPPWSDPAHGRGTPLMALQAFLRAGNSWPTSPACHQPDWSGVGDYVTNRPAVFQLRSDGTRDHAMLCYGNPRTLETYLGNLEQKFSGKNAPSSASVSPNDAEISCYCKDCRKLWDDKGGAYGSASKILGKFVADLGREMKKRWPDKLVAFLAYLNYTAAPDGITFPDNVEVQICGMPGMAMYKEPTVLAAEQKNINRWMELTGRKIQNWHYDCWPEDRTKAVYHYPHVIKEYYLANKDKTVGTFINGDTDHWIRQNISLYCWLKVLWNPDYDVDAAVNEFCKRMFGPAAKTMRELVQLQMDGWEKSRWAGGRLYAKAIHEISYPRKNVLHMEELLNRARAEARGDEPALKRVEYYAAPFAPFFEESKNHATGFGLRPLLAKKAGANPQLDGKLDDAVWEKAQELTFVTAWRGKDKEPPQEPLCPTIVKAVWTADGITFGFRMAEPTPDLMKSDRKGHDDSMLWWNDNIELLFDVTGKNEGEFYHFIITANGTTAEAKDRSFAWNTDQVKPATFIGKDFWSMEVYVPYSAFPEAVKPDGGMPGGIAWSGNFGRHRLGHGAVNSGKRQVEHSPREYTRMNTTYALFSNNMFDFAPIKFVE